MIEGRIQDHLRSIDFNATDSDGKPIGKIAWRAADIVDNLAESQDELIAENTVAEFLSGRQFYRLTGLCIVLFGVILAMKAIS